MQDVALSAGSEAGGSGAAAAPRVDLEWASFPKGAAATAAAPTPSPAAPPAAAAASAAGTARRDDIDASFTPLSLLMPSFYVAAFDVDTVHVKERLLAAVWPFRKPAAAAAPATDGAAAPAVPEGDDAATGAGAAAAGPTNFLSVLNGKPDLYGPVWVAATLVFLIGAGSNLASWLSFTPQPASAVSLWRYDFSALVTALVTVFGYAFGAPLGAWAALNYLGLRHPGGVVTLACLWGYSLTPFLPAALLCVLPSGALQWTAVLGATTLSAITLARATFGAVDATASTPGARRTLLLLVLGAALAFGVCLKLFFFSFAKQA